LRAEAAEVRRKQRRMQGERDKDAVQGPPAMCLRKGLRKLMLHQP